MDSINTKPSQKQGSRDDKEDKKMMWTDQERMDKALAVIKLEFIRRYGNWLVDQVTMENREYGRKYGWVKPETPYGDSLKAVVYFQKNIYDGHWLQDWEKMGVEKEVLWDLTAAGEISMKQWTNRQARYSGRTDKFFFSQKKAKEIWKEIHV